MAYYMRFSCLLLLAISSVGQLAFAAQEEAKDLSEIYANLFSSSPEKSEQLNAKQIFRQLKELLKSPQVEQRTLIEPLISINVGNDFISPIRCNRERFESLNRLLADYSNKSPNIITYLEYNKSQLIKKCLAKLADMKVEDSELIGGIWLDSVGGVSSGQSIGREHLIGALWQLVELRFKGLAARLAVDTRRGKTAFQGELSKLINDLCGDLRRGRNVASEFYNQFIVGPSTIGDMSAPSQNPGQVCALIRAAEGAHLAEDVYEQWIRLANGGIGWREREESVARMRRQLFARSSDGTDLEPSETRILLRNLQEFFQFRVDKEAKEEFKLARMLLEFSQVYSSKCNQLHLGSFDEQLAKNGQWKPIVGYLRYYKAKQLEHCEGLTVAN